MTSPAYHPAAPARIVELDLARPGELRSPGGAAAAPTGRVLALVRRHGRPLGLVTATGTPGDPAGLRRDLVEAGRRLDVPVAPAVPAVPASAAPAAPVPGAERPLVSIIICTRDREDMLPQALDALLRTGYPRAEVLVVDNAPTNDATRELIRTRYPGRVRYLREPVPGLARARNCGLAAAHGEICAFTDDDVIVDPGWVAALVGLFVADDRVGCVTGLVLPAELDTEAQAVFERYGGFSKGFATRRWSLRERPADPLFPFVTSRFGTGANMAFRTGVLRGIGGFDPATGTGTPTRGGEDLLSFLYVLTSGHTVAYQPEALVWHRHRRSMEALTAQIYGFGVGFGAYLTAAVSHRPGLLAGLLKRLPRGLWQWRAVRRGRIRSAPAAGGEALAQLGRTELRGLVRGPFSYLFSVWQQHTLRAGGQL
ncbi:glycosyltransferase [Kitasatospora kazusensis]